MLLKIIVYSVWPPSSSAGCLKAGLHELGTGPRVVKGHAECPHRREGTSGSQAWQLLVKISPFSAGRYIFRTKFQENKWRKHSLSKRVYSKSLRKTASVTLNWHLSMFRGIFAGKRASLLGLANTANVIQILRYKKSHAYPIYLRALIYLLWKHLPKMVIKSRKTPIFSKIFKSF